MAQGTGGKNLPEPDNQQPAISKQKHIIQNLIYVTIKTTRQ